MKKLQLLSAVFLALQSLSFQVLTPNSACFEYKTIEDLVRDHAAYGEKRAKARKKTTIIGGIVGGLTSLPISIAIAALIAGVRIEKRKNPGFGSAIAIGSIPIPICSGIGALIAHHTFEGGAYKFTTTGNSNTTSGGANQFGFLGIHHIGVNHTNQNFQHSSGWGSASKGVELDAQLAQDILDFCKLKGGAPTEISEIENFVKNTFVETFPNIETAPKTWLSDPNHQANFGKVIRKFVEGRFRGR